MRVGQAHTERKPKAAVESSSEQDGAHGKSLRQSVSIAVQSYLEELDGQMGTDVYQMVLAEVEAPLLEEIMRYTRNNQTRASQMLGLNRGTLRKKLKQYGMLGENDA